MNETVLVGFAEAYGAIEATWSLQEAGFRVVAFTRIGEKPALRRVRGVELHEVAAPEQSLERANADVQALASATGAAAYLPLDDGAVWLADALEGTDAVVAGPTGRQIEYALDKALQLEAAREAGLPVPASQVVESLEDVRPKEFPAFVKPARALYEVDGRLVRPTGAVVADEAELAALRGADLHPPLVVQPLLHGTGEGLFGHATKDGVVAWSSHRRVRMLNPQGSASSACETNPLDERLLGPAERFVSALGWRGLFMLEFLRDGAGRPWLMELNGRTWGSMALARRRGYEYPAWAVRAALDESFVPLPPETPPDVLCRNVGLELVHLAFVLRGPQSASLSGSWPRLWPTLRALARPSRRNRLYNWNRSQPRVLAADTWWILRDYAKRAGSR
jgi:predicted ATP-grasp superfamily ATP-dependent carboligase